MTKILKKCKVSFAAIANPEGYKNGKHLYSDERRVYHLELVGDFNPLGELGHYQKEKQRT